MRSDLLRAFVFGLLFCTLLAGGYWLIKDAAPHLTGVGEIYAQAHRPGILSCARRVAAAVYASY